MKTLSYLKVLWITIILSTISFTAFSQVEVMLGGRAGMNVASYRWGNDVRNNKDIDSKSSIGAHVSFVTVMELAPWFGIQAEAQFIQKGGKLFYSCENCAVNNDQGQAVQFKSFSQELKIQANYMELPILARFKLGGDNVAFNGFLGPAFSIALNGTEQFTQDQTDAQDKETTATKTTKLNFDKEYNRFDIGGVVGAGMEFGAGPGAIIFDLRFELGISDATKQKNLDERIKNRGFQIGLGYIVRL